MKTCCTFIIAIAFLFVGLKVQAQDFSYGIQTGLVVANARVANKIDIYQDYRIFYPLYALSFNGFVEYKISKPLGLEAGIGFIRNGGVVAFGINHYTSIIDMKLDYIQLPLIANLYLTKNFSLSMGLGFSYLVTKEENLPKAGTGFVQFKDNAFEMSGLIGLNYSISRKFAAGIRYNHGLTKISVLESTDGYGPVIGKSNVYNQYFQLLLRFKLKA